MLLGSIAACVALAASAAGAAPAAPPREAIVESQLLPAAVKSSVRQLASAAALNASERLARVRALIEAGRAGGDPRSLGYAEALLAVWPATSPTAPVDALVLRATIEQSRHRFDAARALLDRVLAQSPAHGQALLTRATIATVTGEYVAARRDCTQLQPLHAVAAAICNASVDAATGAEARALDALRAAARDSAGSLRGWALAALAQVHEQRGEIPAAAEAYRAALASGEGLVTRLGYADMLIDSDAHAQALALLAEAPPADGVLVRRWLAERARGEDNAPLAAELQSRFAEARARGDLLHAREAAMFALARGDAAAALQLAQENWAVQREPADLLMLARAARAAGDRLARDRVENWLRASGLRDARIATALGNP
jgi:tetratricopeptide (TPR) repeat protein